MDSRTDRADIPADIIEHLFTQHPQFRPAAAVPRPGLCARAQALARALPILGRLAPAPDLKQALIDQLLAQQQNATTYRQWYDASAQLDELSGNNLWKATPQCRHYDHRLVQKNLEEMRSARLRKDHKLLLYLIRTKWTRNVGNMGALGLYRHSHVGTKRLVEEYIEECRQCLHYLVHDPSVHLNDRYLLGMLIQTRKNIGRTALVLSGGSTFSLSHVGVLVALLENSLVPRIISGSSSGSIIASILCCHTNDEIGELLMGITERRFTIFGTESEKDGRLKVFLQRIGHLLKFGTFFDISGLRQTMYDFVGNITFREAYNRTGKILNVTVSPATKHEQTRLLNYLTAPNCLVWSAICASCLLPGIFPSNSIYEKNPSTNKIHEWNNDESSKYVDGSVDGDLPILRLSEMFNVDHIIAVQVNPHVSPILKVSVSSVGGKADSELSETVKGLLNNAYDFITSEIIHALQILHEMNIYQNLTLKLISLLSQLYSGDITILPQLELRDFLKVFQNPTPQFMLDFILKGAKAAWPKITVINNHCGVEFALDKEISFVRGRLIAEANNRIAQGFTDFPKAFDSNDYLVSSPVLAEEANAVSPAKQRAKAKIRRHNLVTSGEARWQRHSPVVHRKRNSVSFVDRNLSFRGKSTTSLYSMGGKERESPFFKTPQAKYISNGGDGDSQSTRGTSFDFRSPHHEKYLDTDYVPASPKSEPREPRDKANLPRVLRAGSLRNSYVGLNRIKNSGEGDSPLSSPKSLEKAYLELEKNFKNLQPATLRQHFKKPKEEKRLSFYLEKGGDMNGKQKIDEQKSDEQKNDEQNNGQKNGQSLASDAVAETKKNGTTTNDEDDAESFEDASPVLENSVGYFPYTDD